MDKAELYIISRGNTSKYYTSSSVEIEYEGQVFTPLPIGRGVIELKNEINKSSLEIQIDIFNELSEELIRKTYEHSVTITVIIIRDTISGVAWKGRLVLIEPEKTTLKLTFENIFSSLKRPGLRAKYQKICRHALYSKGCFVDMNNFAKKVTIDKVNEEIVYVIEELSSESYIGGILKITDMDMGYIINQEGRKLTLQHVNENLADLYDKSGYGKGYGMVYGGSFYVTLHLGCNRSMDDCIDKFNNLDNYGGFPYIPAENILDGSSLV